MTNFDNIILHNIYVHIHDLVYIYISDLELEDFFPNIFLCNGYKSIW